MSRPTATVESLQTLLRLIDDDTPEVRRSLALAMEVFGGDVSELLPETRAELSLEARDTLSELLLPARRERLRREWIVPTRGAASLDGDWERFEALLRVLSDFLHDGVSLRQPLGDALDLLADEAAPAHERAGPEGLCAFLLGEERLRATLEPDPEPRHHDLGVAIQGAPASGIALGLILLLVAQRLGSPITGLCAPNVFFCRIEGRHGPRFLDPGAGGAMLEADEFEHRIRRHPESLRELAADPADTGELLLRYVDDLFTACALHDRTEDALLLEELHASLLPGS